MPRHDARDDQPGRVAPQQAEPTAAPTPRPAARAVVVDTRDRLLLVRFVDPSRGASWWATPGGGLEPGETHEQAVRREVAEETGLHDVEVGPWIWTRRHVYTSRGVAYRQDERFFLIRVTPFEPHPTALGAGEASFVRGLHWWTVDELAATRDELAPAELPRLFRALLDSGPPGRPRAVGA